MRYERPIAFLASYGLPFQAWLNLARSYDNRHYTLYAEFSELEANAQ